MKLLILLLCLCCLCGCETHRNDELHHTESSEITDRNNAIHTEDGFVFERSEGGLILTAYNGKETDVTVPGTVENESVVMIGEKAFLEKNVTSIQLPDTIQRIGSSAFSACTMLESIDMKNGIRKIGDGAFNYCLALSEIILPESVSEIGEGCFVGCSSLKTIIIPLNVRVLRDRTFGTVNNTPCGLTEIAIGTNITDIGEGVFSDKLTAFHVSEDNPVFTDIDGVLMTKDTQTILIYPAGNLREVYEVPSEIKYIGENAFNKASHLKEITVSENVEALAFRSLSGCTSLEKITFLSDTTMIDPYAFYSGGISIKNGVSKPLEPTNYSFVIICRHGSTAEQFAQENQIAVEYME